MKAMIFAAGEGRRMRPLTLATPKPLLQIGGISLLEHQIWRLQRAGVSKFVINAAYLSDQIVAAVAAIESSGIICDVSVEERPLETGGGLLRALPYLGRKPFLLINSDVWIECDFQAFVLRTLKTDILAHLVLVESPSHNTGGDFGVSETGLCVLPSTEGKNYTFSGLSIMRPELISGFPQQREVFPLREALMHAIRAGCVTAEVFYGEWLDIGTPERLEQARSLYARSQAT